MRAYARHIALLFVTLVSAMQAQSGCNPPRLNSQVYMPTLNTFYYSMPSSGFVGNEESCAEEGFSLWEQGTPGIGTAFRKNGGGAISVVFGMPKDTNGNDCPDCPASETHSFDALGRFTGGTIILNANRDVLAGCDKMRHAMLHEVAHFYGLDDGGPGGNIMDTNVPFGSVSSLNACDTGAANMHSGVGESSGNPGAFLNDTCQEGGIPGFRGPDGCCYVNAFSTQPAYQVAQINIQAGIHITWPPNGSWYPAPVEGPVNVHAMDADGYVWRVDYLMSFNGGPEVTAYTSTTAPFTWYTGTSTPGTYVIRAVAYDNEDQYKISDPITVHVY